MKPLVIYHDHCTDGFGAAFAAWLKLGDDADYLPMAYGDSPFEAEHADGRDVYILDFSFPRDVMDTMFRVAKRVVWLDHHKTAFEMWTEGYRKGDRFTATPLGGDDPLKHYIVLDNNKSGALLAWEYFHPDVEAPMLIKHIDDRDRWQFKLEGSKELHAALQSYKPWSFAQWEDDFLQLAKPDTFYRDDMFGQGAAILRAQDQHVASMAKQARACEIAMPIPNGGWRATDAVFVNGLACNATLHISEIGHVLATQSGTYALIWYVSQDNKVKCSLRSNGDYDVSAIAKALGGGGHHNAAGFETDFNTLMGWIR